MAKKGGKTSAPDYSAIYAAQNDLANQQLQMAREQMQWAREQYERDRGVSDRVVEQLLGTMESESQAAAADRERYKTVFQPVEDRFVQTALNYDTPQRREADAARAIADVTQAFDANRRAAAAQLESYGIDPSTTRGQALDISMRTAQGAAAAGAANTARRMTEDRGIELVGQAVNLGRGYPAQIAAGYGTAQGAGSGAVSGQLATTGSGGQTMGTGLGWSQGATGTLGQWGNQVTSQVNNANNLNYQRDKNRSDSLWRGIGAVTGLLGAPMSGLSGSVGAAGLRGLGFIG